MRKNGFTLIELMITVAVVALLAAIAYPSYRSQVLRSNRTEAKVALMSASQSLEKCYTTANTYVGCAALAQIIGNTVTGRYTISAGAGNANITANAYTLLATPQGGQADDDDCASFTMTQAGRTATREGGADNTATCWR